MSKQEDDIFIFNDKKYDLLAVEFQDSFLNFDFLFGLKPVEFSTACWRGFILTFSVKNDKLVIDKIHTNNGNDETQKIPKINGIMPKITTPKGLVEGYTEYRILNYTNLNMFVNYTGSIIIASGFIGEYASGPYAFLEISPFCYKNIVKLEFNDGELANFNDLSKIGDIIRDDREKTLKSKKKSNAYFGWPSVNNIFSNDILKINEKTE